jgi:GNAT superfamily N-acetyltransferase
VTVRRVDPRSRRQLNAFVALERDLYADEPLAWHEPLGDQRKRWRGRSAYSDAMDFSLWIAEHDGRPVGRCAAVVNRRWQESHDDRRGAIGWIAAAREADGAVTEMLARAEDWLAAQDATAALAGFGGTAFLELGMLTGRFEESPMFPLRWDPPHLAPLLEAAGYERRYPLWAYWVDFASERYRRARDLALGRPGCTIREVSKARWKDELELLRALFNEGMRDEWELHQYTREEFAETYAPLKAIQDPRLMLFAECDGEPAGFAFGFGDLTPLFRSFGGRLGPRQVLQLMRKGKRWSRGGLVGIAVLDRFRGRGVGRALAARFFANLEEMGSPGSFYYLVNDHNRRSRAVAEAFGGEGRLDYHVLEKVL